MRMTTLSLSLSIKQRLEVHRDMPWVSSKRSDGSATCPTEDRMYEFSGRGGRDTAGDGLMCYEKDDGCPAKPDPFSSSDTFTWSLVACPDTGKRVSRNTSKEADIVQQSAASSEYFTLPHIVCRIPVDIQWTSSGCSGHSLDFHWTFSAIFSHWLSSEGPVKVQYQWGCSEAF